MRCPENYRNSRIGPGNLSVILFMLSDGKHGEVEVSFQLESASIDRLVELEIQAKTDSTYQPDPN